MLTTVLLASLFAQPEIPNAKPLEPADGNARSVAMVAGIDKFLMRKTEEISADRRKRWEAMAKEKLADRQPMRTKLQTMLGLRGPLGPRRALPALQFPIQTSLWAQTDDYEIHSVFWNRTTEGLMVSQRENPEWFAVAIPDSSQTPEMICGLSEGLPPESQFGRLLAEAGANVLIPAMVDLNSKHSGNEDIRKSTKQPHREWIYRQSYEMGRHLLGFEVDKVRGAGMWLKAWGENQKPVVAVGHGEGGLVALYAAALDPNLFAGVYISGAFHDKSELWKQPIWRNVFGILADLDDPEIAALAFPTNMFIDNALLDTTSRGKWRAKSGATPGLIESASKKSFLDAIGRLNQYAEGSWRSWSGSGLAVKRSKVVVVNGDQKPSPLCSGLDDFLKTIGKGEKPGSRKETPPTKKFQWGDRDRQHRVVEDLTDKVQRELQASERVRRELWKDLDPKKIPADKWHDACSSLREKFRKEVIGEFEDKKSSANPRGRKLKETANWVMHEVVLDVWPEVFAWGYLLLPKDLKAGEKRPVVVCQHGLEGLPEDCVTEDPKSNGFQYYQSFAAKLADRGFITFVPHNPYRGGDKFRVLQRKANPLGRSLFSIIVAQHQVITEWLSGLPFVDPSRFGFYGLSYGGKTAMRVPALVDRYCLSICSADFNDWIRKNVVVDDPHSYMFTGEYEMPEFNLGRTFNYAEMAALIAPRPFMVERGHHDGVAPDEWVAYEYAKVRRLYAELKIPQRTEIEFFLGPHRINGVGTFEFLHRHLNWPKR
jgi:dienelactone hydrolase